MQLEIARNFAEIRNEKHRRGGKPARPVIGEQVTAVLVGKRIPLTVAWRWGCIRRRCPPPLRKWRLDAAYDQAAYAPNREQLIKRRINDSELARLRVGEPEHSAPRDAQQVVSLTARTSH
jgi:hypothetical protein